MCLNFTLVLSERRYHGPRKNTERHTGVYRLEGLSGWRMLKASKMAFLKWPQSAEGPQKKSCRGGMRRRELRYAKFATAPESCAMAF